MARTLYLWCIILGSAFLFGFSAVKASPLVSITDVADSCGFAWQWESRLFRLTCVQQPLQIKLYEDNAFCLINGAPRRLPQAPVRCGGALCLPEEIVRGLFCNKGASALQVTTPQAIPAPASGKNILSVTSEKKSNGTLLTIQLADSLPLDITYFYPNLTFNFFGGTLDTSTMRQRSRVGVVDSVFSTQFSVSAQITAILAHEIEEPMVDYIVDTRTVMISLWPKKAQRAGKGNAATTKIPEAKKTDGIKTDSTMTIVIDPGHGGKDPGAIGGGGVKEKDVVLAIALKVRESLTKNRNLTVHMTRDKDVFIPLADRTKFANEKKAHLFISIHADAVGGTAMRKQVTKGYKIYFLSQAKNEDDKLVAMRENAVIDLEERPQQYSQLQNVLIEMAGNEYLRESQDLCILIDQKFETVLDKKIAKLHKGIGQANFWVLNGAYMPSVLIEAGFLSHKKEEKLLGDATFQKSMASAVTDAVITFCKRFQGADL